MANHPSALKRARQSEKRRLRNRSVNSAVRTAVKKFNSAIASSEVETVKAALKDVSSRLDRAASKGVLPKGRVSRKISRLSREAMRVISPVPETTAE
ncbi:SSU ribosomal protein S20p [hydrothermal vent metagenome]|uniref:SSU ribosomal protein S20p n=1 Tax=hydrothermal vent metagenome TaxID=652676 RepID=A0A3B1DE87_9ZZZZ